MACLLDIRLFWTLAKGETSGFFLGQWTSRSTCVKFRPSLRFRFLENMLGHPQPALFFQGWGGGRFPDISLAQNRCKCEGQRTTVGEFGQHLLIHQQQLGIQPNDCCAFPFLTYFRCSILRIPCLIPPSLCSFTRGLWTRRGGRLWRVPSSVHIRRRKIRVQLFSSFRSTPNIPFGSVSLQIHIWSNDQVIYLHWSKPCCCCCCCCCCRWWFMLPYTLLLVTSRSLRLLVD